MFSLFIYTFTLTQGETKMNIFSKTMSIQIEGILTCVVGGIDSMSQNWRITIYKKCKLESKLSGFVVVYNTND